MRSITARVAAVVSALAVAGCGHSTARPASAPPATDPLATKWRWTAPPPSYVGMPAGDDSGVAVTSGHSHLVLLDPSGGVRWTADRPRLRDVAPRLTTDVVLAPTEDGLVAYDRLGGTLRWATALGERANTPAVEGAVVVVSTWEGSLIGVDRATGSVLWRATLAGPALGPATVVGDVAVVSWESDHAGGAGLVGVDASTGRQRWSTAVPAGGVSGPGPVAVPGVDPLVVVVAGDAAAHAVDAASGEERWRVDVGGAGSPEVVALDAGGGATLVADRLGGMALLEGSDGRARWQVTSDGAAVRGGPAGPGPAGTFALPLEDGRLLVAGPGRTEALIDPPGRVSGVARGPGGTLLVGIREAPDNDLTASTGW